MADFCTKCSIEMFGEDVEPDIDIDAIASTLEPDTYRPVLCEGCGMKAIGKDKDGNILIAVPVDENAVTSTKVNWIPYEEWKKNYKGLHIPADESN